jgi:tetratricopeptide (TPR) repeat protein
MKKRFQPSVRSYESLIKVLLRFKAIDKCEKLLEEVTQRKLDNSTIICILLNGFKENKLYEKAIELDPEDAVAYNNLGLVEEKLGRMEKAKDNFEKADSLSGYPPKKEVETAPTALPNPSEKSKATRPEYHSSKSTLTFGHFLEVIQGVFTKTTVRKEFATFIKGLFAKKEANNF